MMYGVTLQPNKPVEVDADSGDIFHLSQACLTDNGSAGKSYVQITVDDKTFVLCCLEKGKVEHATMDILVDVSNSKCKLSVKGNAEVCVTGYMEPSPEDYMNAMLGGVDGEDEEEDEDVDIDEEDDEEDEEEEAGKGMTKAEQLAAIKKMIGQGVDDDEDDEDMDGDDDDDEEDEDEENDDESMDEETHEEMMKAIMKMKMKALGKDMPKGKASAPQPKAQAKVQQKKPQQAQAAPQKGNNAQAMNGKPLGVMPKQKQTGKAK